MCWGHRWPRLWTSSPPASRSFSPLASSMVAWRKAQSVWFFSSSRTLLTNLKQFSTRQLTTVASYWSAPGLLLSPVQSILRLVLTSISIGQLQVSVVKVWNKGKIREKFPSQWINRHWLKLSEGSEGKLTTESKTIGEWDGLNNLVVGIDYWTIWL